MEGGEDEDGFWSLHFRRAGLLFPIPSQSSGTQGTQDKRTLIVIIAIVITVHPMEPLWCKLCTSRLSPFLSAALAGAVPRPVSHSWKPGLAEGLCLAQNYQASTRPDPHPAPRPEPEKLKGLQGQVSDISNWKKRGDSHFCTSAPSLSAGTHWPC